MNQSPRRVVFASSNKGKLAELERLFADCGVAFVAQREFDVVDAVEDGASFVENAIIKARHAASSTGLPALADDSGLVVDALGGEPGIYSARYSGVGASDDANVQKLLRELAHDADASRAARFVCVMAFVRDARDPCPVLGEGEWHGRILESARGDGGFGYDPVFLPAESDLCAAELEPDVKAQRSHRGAAARELLQRLRLRGLVR